MLEHIVGLFCVKGQCPQNHRCNQYPVGQKILAASGLFSLFFV